MRRVISWMEEHGLSLAVQKIEIVLHTKKSIKTFRSFAIGVATVQTKSADKYLGIMLDSKLNYGEHIIRAADKAAKVVASLGTLMANVNGPRPCMSRLLMRAAEAVMLYSANASGRGGNPDQSTSSEKTPAHSSSSRSPFWERRRHQSSPSLAASRPGKADGNRSLGADDRLISRLDNWLNREMGEVDFNLTQF
ncbi:uncharacterized protein LOC124948579 [Vespa velutina]|uniref:uncharacterized protein LOC124948579 n=1 Tax=Vespa velutina TaxID=202808 RepID=UPI001FB236AB|nr:uncharacterized protein LOC124948579 [Vespa velutina]